MRKISLFIALIFLLEGLAAAPALAVRRTHRPWMLVKSASAARPAAAKPVVRAKTASRAVPRTHVRREKLRPRVVAARPAAPTARKANDPGTKVVQRALEYKGTRYRFGGSSEKGMDCSGLVARIFNDLKLKKLPRASASLYQHGEPVRLSELRPGDLVFFKNTYRRGISHVGIYAGNNRFVHAASRKGVTLTSMADPYYQLHYAGAKRLF